jgi:UPF0755 protein
MRKLIVVVVVIFIFLCVLYVAIPSVTAQTYGAPASWLTPTQRVRYSLLMHWYDGLLTRPANLTGAELPFAILPGESVTSVSENLQASGLIRDAKAFRAYLIYSGLDTSVQAGEYKLSPALSAIDIAHELQDATSEDVSFVILPGWRMEEIAALLPTSGLPFTPEEFVRAVNSPPARFDFLSGADTAEGFLYPDTYILPRNTSADLAVDEFLRNFAVNITGDMRTGFESQGLTVNEAVILASVVEREAIHAEEAPLIASVYLNRLRNGIRLEADPTVQYAIGFNGSQNNWWTNPLSAEDLKYDSPYNTYMYGGLPPGPISNPGPEALNAVAFPAETPYYFFRARCDGSGYHSFAETFEEHIANGCE